MLKLVLTLCVALSSLLIPNVGEARGGSYSSGDFAGKAVMKGDGVVFPKNLSGYYWNVQNPTNISNKDRAFKFGDQCQAKPGGTLKVIALDNDALLIRYSVSGAQTGKNCPNETLFYESPEQFNMIRWQRHIEEVYAHGDQERKERIKKLLKD